MERPLVGSRECGQDISGRPPPCPAIKQKSDGRAIAICPLLQIRSGKIILPLSDKAGFGYKEFRLPLQERQSALAIAGSERGLRDVNSPFDHGIISRATGSIPILSSGGMAVICGPFSGVAEPWVARLAHYPVTAPQWETEWALFAPALCSVFSGTGSLFGSLTPRQCRPHPHRKGFVNPPPSYYPKNLRNLSKRLDWKE
ncbi:hypothetical protein AVEN_84645-1 [Araneus ventricosus]|uniref:Uncharacterized protein n=1 Tax=Araneus ventricosus TaxID=182803 RepID=A0A4Y2HK87_ARAVE|nr:hypothetical protein AVEN_84645-1 [Araneus ventricosus]